jgi:hypothetical protein
MTAASLCRGRRFVLQKYRLYFNALAQCLVRAGRAAFIRMPDKYVSRARVLGPVP